jgi:membrane associated rhomboid family serine protease
MAGWRCDLSAGNVPAGYGISIRMSLQYQTEEQTAEVGPYDEREVYAEAEPVVPVYTYAMIVVIVAVSAAQLARGLETSVLLAGFDKPVFSAGEYWRILTGAAAHGGLLHLFMNSYALLGFGRLVETLSNRAHLAIVFLLSAVGGGLLSLWAVPDGRSVGASGGIVGLLSYLAVYAFRRRKFISYEFRKSLLINIGFILLFGLALYQIIDNYGHIGGLIVGAVYGLLQIPADEYVDPREVRGSTEFLGLLALGTYIAAALFSIWLILS